MSDDKKNQMPPPLHLVEPGKDAEQEKVEAEVVGIPFLKDKYLTIFDNTEEPNVMIFSIPIRQIALEPGRDAFALLLGKIEVLKGDAHKLYKSIRADEAARGPKLIRPGGGKLPPLAHS